MVKLSNFFFFSTSKKKLLIDEDEVNSIDLLFTLEKICNYCLMKNSRRNSIRYNFISNLVMNKD